MCYNEANMGYHSQIFIKKGNPKMKKLIAILLSAAMLVAMFAIVVSADETNLALGKSYDAKGYQNTDEWGTADYTANLTDGIDGLLTGVSIPIVMVLGVLAYLSGHIIYSDYLNIMYIPTAQSSLSLLRPSWVHWWASCGTTHSPRRSSWVTQAH